MTKPDSTGERSVPANRPLIVHYHIFKNAGTSVDALLKRSFGPAWTSFDGRSATDIVSCDRLRRFIADRPELKAVSSHLARPPLPSPSAYPIVFLRHPIARTRSVYAFAAADSTQPYHRIARTRGFRGYVEWALRSGSGGIVVRNYQVVHLSEASFRAPHIFQAKALDRDLAMVKSMIKDWGAIGIVRRFADSCRLFQERYGGIFPELHMPPVHENASGGMPATEMDEVEAVREALGESLYGDLLGANALDLSLYEFALAQFEDARGRLRSPASA